MRKIYSFSKFNAIYEEETSSSELNVAETEASKLYDQTLGLILTTILNSYNSVIFCAETIRKDPKQMNRLHWVSRSNSLCSGYIQKCNNIPVTALFFLFMSRTAHTNLGTRGD